MVSILESDCLKKESVIVITLIVFNFNLLLYFNSK